MSSHFIVAKISGISDLESVGLIRPLQFESVSNRVRASRKKNRRTGGGASVGWASVDRRMWGSWGEPGLRRSAHLVSLMNGGETS